ncbi:MAG: hypothetical protein MUF34_15145 [Polyangiaceae bacterium]|nr:hypothetical protein [Polyangiaceae bacterium]
MAPMLPPSARLLRAAALGLALAALSLPSTARAQQEDESPAEGDPLRLPAPIQLRVEPTEDGLWKMTLTNRSDATWRVAADARLLAVDLIGAPLPDLVARKQKGGAKPRSFPHAKLTHCQMPAGMRPSGITPSRALVLRPGERYVEVVHPVALCGAAAVVDALGPGAIVYPSFGTPEKRKKNAPPRPLPPPPYVAEPLREQEGVVPLRWLDATPFVMPDEPLEATAERPAADPPAASSPAAGTPAASASAASASAASASAASASAASAPATPPAPAPLPSSREPDDYAPRLTLQAPKRGDAASDRSATISATLRNTGKTPVTMRLRPDALVFRIRPFGASRATECGFANARRASVRDFFSTLGAGKAQSLVAILGEVCPGGVLDRPGLYEVWPRVELHESGERFDVAAVTGSFATTAPTLVRIRSGKQPYHDHPPEALSPEGEAPRPPPPDAGGPPPPSQGLGSPPRGPTPPSLGSKPHPSDASPASPSAPGPTPPPGRGPAPPPLPPRPSDPVPPPARGPAAPPPTRATTPAPSPG